MVLHGLNAILCMINLCGLEIRLCNFNAICTLGFVELLALVWLQWGYFNAQEFLCITSAPFLYFWLMAQIMFLYLGCAFACCHFARKYFSEDVEDSDIDSEEDDF